jgi:hypothetical protein
MIIRMSLFGAKNKNGDDHAKNWSNVVHFHEFYKKYFYLGHKIIKSIFYWMSDYFKPPFIMNGAVVSQISVPKLGILFRPT